MALITCPECGKQISDKAKTCPNCGCPVSDMNTENAEDKVPQKSMQTMWQEK